MKTAIVGGGIAGLAAAYELERACAAGADVEYTLFESQARLGGVIWTEIDNGIVLERGPDSFLSEKPATAELCRELGLGDQLIPSNDASRKTYIVVKNRMVPMPDGLMFMVPTKLMPTAMTGLFSLKTKMRMGLELMRRPRLSGAASTADESVAALVARHYGQEAVDRLADPLLSGIYGGDASQLSARSVLPRFVEMEREHGSLTRGMLASRRAMLSKAKGVGSGGQAQARSIFTSLRGGMQQLTDALAARLDADSIRCGTIVTAVKRVADGWLVDAGGVCETFDAVVIAAPAWAAAGLLTSVDAELCDDLRSIPYSSSITVNLVFDENQMVTLPDGFGFLVPKSEGRAMLACTFVHRKFAGRAPVGKAVLRVFLGGIKNEGMLDESDEMVIGIVRRELREILGIDAPPERVMVARWRSAMAQYAVGHKDRIDRISARVAALPGLRLVGNAYDGIGISDCIRLGRAAARELMAAGERDEQPVG